jgi:hypothetical protein
VRAWGRVRAECAIGADGQVSRPGLGDPCPTESEGRCATILSAPGSRRRRRGRSVAHRTERCASARPARVRGSSALHNGGPARDGSSAGSTREQGVTSFGRRRSWALGGAPRCLALRPQADGKPWRIELGRQSCQCERGQHQAEVPQCDVIVARVGQQVQDDAG